eukprot:TRINITY_DN286_c3_g2_i1.p1 TRINITY_DN286_c3_g2~~TRINITY_DN286_c3_g2_i1.p1  ORF type:complete len:102 (-),score=35.15 TRINITY_DN286_c3_g2_i1:45-350(-)
MAFRRIVPTLDRVLVERLKPKNVTPSGLQLPESPNKISNKAKVLAVGRGKYSGDTLIEPEVKVGDIVILPESFLSVDIEVDGEKYVMLKEEDILARYNENE